MTEYFLNNGACGTENTFKIIGSKWIPQILEICSNSNGTTFSKIKALLTPITDATLSRQINKLLTNDMIVRNPDASLELTNKANDILPVMIMMQKMAYECKYESSDFTSSVEYTKKLIGNKWKSRIIWVIYHTHTIRFNSLQNSIEGISHKILTAHLNDLIKHGFINKKDYASKNPKVEYSLTTKGITAYSIIESMAEWCVKYGMIVPYTPTINHSPSPK